MARATKLISLLLLHLANSLSALDFKTFAFEGQFSDLFYLQGESEVPSTSMASEFQDVQLQWSSPLIFMSIPVAGEKNRTPLLNFPMTQGIQACSCFCTSSSGGYQFTQLRMTMPHPPGTYRVQNLTP